MLMIRGHAELARDALLCELPLLTIALTGSPAVACTSNRPAFGMLWSR